MPHVSPESTIEPLVQKAVEFQAPKQDYVRVFEEVVSDISREEELSAESNAMLELLLDEKPGEVVSSEVLYLLGAYADRALVETRPDGTELTRFATRNTADPEKPWIDDRYTIGRYPDGSMDFTITALTTPFEGNEVVVRRGGQVEVKLLRCSASIADDGRNFNEDTIYHMPVAPTRDLYHEVLSETVRRALETLRVVADRQEKDPEGAARAHQQAREMLAAQIGAEL